MKVTAIMLTRGRPELARKALNSFLLQTYPEKEMIIIDDYAEPSFPEPPTMENVLHFPSALRSIAEKRNLACAMAEGELVCHWDDDDWSAPERIADQVDRLLKSFVSVTGYHSMLFYEESTGRAAKYVSHRAYALGTSLMYRREWWLRNKFTDQTEVPNVGEDNIFVRTASQMGELISVDAERMMVARAHPGNTSPKNMNDFNSFPVTAIPSEFFL